MSAPHVIRLRGPWTMRVPGRKSPDADAGAKPGQQPAETKVQVPVRLRAEFHGHVQLIRHFNRPTGIGPATRVSLVIQHVEGQAEARLNDQWLGACEPGNAAWRLDVSRELRPRNEIRIDLRTTAPERDRSPLSDERREILGEVALEISDATPPADSES